MRTHTRTHTHTQMETLSPRTMRYITLRASVAKSGKESRARGDALELDVLFAVAGLVGLVLRVEGGRADVTDEARAGVVRPVAALQ